MPVRIDMCEEIPYDLVNVSGEKAGKARDRNKERKVTG